MGGALPISRGVQCDERILQAGLPPLVDHVQELPAPGAGEIDGALEPFAELFFVEHSLVRYPKRNLIRALQLQHDREELPGEVSEDAVR